MQLEIGEKFEDLMFGGLKIIQYKGGYCFTTDSVLLANFSKCKKEDNLLEMCSGSGVISILLYARCKPNSVVGIDIQPRLCDMANRSAAFNKLNDKIVFKNMKIQDAPKQLGKEKFDVIVCNPPYNSQESSGRSSTEEIAIARHEIKMKLEDMFIAASKLLKFGGKFFFIHRADRLDEIFEISIKYKLRPKVLQIVSPKPSKPAHLVLIECIKGSKPGISVLPHLYITQEEGDLQKEAIKLKGFKQAIRIKGNRVLPQ